ncbi:MAG: hypothetical protein IKC48_04005 [Clostridia bacterium]|nr:hypothetical protein [Clostridia bacterium]
MKKQKMCKILLMLVVMVALAISSFVMVACPAPEEHTEHTYGEWTIVTEATCTTTGSKVKVCSGCEEGTDGHKVTETIPALGHEWGEGTVTQDATYNTAGVKTFTCANDNTHTKTEDVAATGIPAMYRGTWICPDMGVEIEVEEDDITMTITSGAVAEITAWDGANGEFEIEFTVTVDDEDEFYVINAEYVAADADADDDYECDVFVCEMLEVGDTEPMNMVFYAEDDLFTVTVNVNDEDFGEVLFYSPYVAPGGFAYVVVAPAEGYEVESVMAGEVELTYVDDAAMYVLTNVTEDVTITVTFAEEAVEPPVPSVSIPEAFHGVWERAASDGFYEFTITENGIAALVGGAGGAPASYNATNIAIQGTDLAFTVNGVNYVMFAPEGGTAMVSIAGAMPPVEFTNHSYVPPVPSVSIPEAFHGVWERAASDGFYEFTITENGIAALVGAAGGAPASYNATNIAIQGTDLAFTVNGVNYVMFAPEGGTAMVSIAGAMPPVEFTNYDYVAPSVSIPAGFHGTWTDGTNTLVVTETGVVYNGEDGSDYAPNGDMYRFSIGATNYQMYLYENEIWLSNLATYATVYLTKEGTEPGPGPDVPGPGEDEEEYEFSGNQLGTWRGVSAGEDFVVVIEPKKVTINGDEYTEFDEYGRISIPEGFITFEFSGNTMYCTYGINDPVTLTKEVLTIAEGYRGTWLGGGYTMVVTETTITLSTRWGNSAATGIAASADPAGYTFVIGEDTYLLYNLNNNSVTLRMGNDADNEIEFTKEVEGGEEEDGIPAEYHGVWEGLIYTFAISADEAWVTYGGNVYEGSDITLTWDRRHTQIVGISFTANGIGFQMSLPEEGIAWGGSDEEAEDLYYVGEFERPETPAPSVTFSQEEQGTWNGSFQGMDFVVTVTETGINVTYGGFQSYDAIDIEFTEGAYWFYIGSNDPEEGLRCSLTFNGNTAVLNWASQAQINLTKAGTEEPGTQVVIDPAHYGVWEGETTLNNYLVRITLSGEGVAMYFIDADCTVSDVAVIAGGYSFTAVDAYMTYHVVLTYNANENTFFADLEDGWREATLTKQGAQPDPEPDPVEFTEQQQGVYTGTSVDTGATYTIEITADAVLFGEDKEAVTGLAYKAGQSYPYSFTFNGTLYSFTFAGEYVDFIVGDWEDGAELYIVPVQQPIPEGYRGTWLDDENILVITDYVITFNDAEGSEYDDYGSEYRFRVNGTLYRITVNGNTITIFNFTNYDEFTLYKEGTQPATFTADQQGNYADEDETYTIELSVDGLLFGGEAVTNLVYSRRQAYPYSFTYNETVYSFAFDGEAITLVVGDGTVTLTKVVDEEPTVVVFEDKTLHGYWVGTLNNVEYTVLVDETGVYVNGVAATSYTVTDGGRNADVYNIVVNGVTYGYSVVGYYKTYVKFGTTSSTYNYKYNAIAYFSDGTAGIELYAPEVRFADDIVGKYTATVGEGDAAVDYELELKKQTSGSWLSDAVTLKVGSTTYNYQKHNGLVPLNLLGDNRNGWKLFGTDYEIVIKAIATDYEGVYSTALVVNDLVKDIEVNFGGSVALSGDYDGTWYGTHGEDSVKLYFNEYGDLLITEDGEYAVDVVYYYDYTENEETVTSFALKLADAEGSTVWMALKAIADGSFTAINLADNSTYSFNRPEGIGEIESVLFGTWEGSSYKLIIGESVTLGGKEASYVAANEGVYTLIVDGVEYTFELVENDIVLTDVYKDTEATLALQIAFAPEYFGTWRDGNNVEMVISEKSVTYGGKTSSAISWSRNAQGVIEYYAFDIVEGEGEEAVTTTHKISNLETETNIIYYNDVELEVITASFDLTVGEDTVTFYYQNFPSNSASYNVAAGFSTYFGTGDTYAAGGYYGNTVYAGVGNLDGYSLLTMTEDAYFVMDGVSYRANTITLIEYDENLDYAGIRDSVDLCATYEFWINNRANRVVAILGSVSSATERMACVIIYDEDGNEVDFAGLSAFVATSTARNADFMGDIVATVNTGDEENPSETSYVFSVYDSGTTTPYINTYFNIYTGSSTSKVTPNNIHPIYGANKAIVGYGFYGNNQLYTVLKTETGYTINLPTGESYSATKFAGFDEEYYGTWKGFKLSNQDYHLTINESGITAMRLSNSTYYKVFALAPRADGGYWFVVHGSTSYYNYIYLDEEGKMGGKAGNSTIDAGGIVKHVPLQIEASYQGTWKGMDDEEHEHIVVIGTNTITITMYNWYYGVGMKPAVTVAEAGLTELEDGGYQTNTINSYFVCVVKYNEEDGTLTLTMRVSTSQTNIREVVLTKEVAEA